MADHHAEAPAHVLRELRRTRTARRVQKLEWFEAAYNAYLAALAAAVVLYAASGLVGSETISADGRDDLFRLTPHIVGLVAATWAAIGLRSGAQGGPLSVEEPDVRLLLTAPIPLRLALRGPIARHVRHVAFVSGAAGGLAGQLLARRLDASLVPWLACGALAGLALGVSGTSLGFVAHAVRLPVAAATAVGTLLVSWQVAALWWDGFAPFDAFGHLVLWPHDLHTAGAAALLLTAGLAGVAVVAAGRLSVEHLVRRSGLVSQLRFAVTLQDLRTITLLRRQLGMEQSRSRPWFRVGAGGRWAVWRRSWQSYARFPLRRVVRLAALATVSALALSAGFTTSRALVFVAAGTALLAGLEILEPLSQELDHPDRTEQLPVTRTFVVSHHLAGPVAAMAGLALVTAGVSAAAWHTAEAALMAAPVALAWGAGGLAGAALNAAAGAPDPLARARDDLLLPPEVAGLREAFRLLKPVALVVVGCLPIVSASAAADSGRQPVPAAVQSSLASLLFSGGVLWYVSRRDDLRARWLAFTADTRGTTRP
jgi:hypothetical protein